MWSIAYKVNNLSFAYEETYKAKNICDAINQFIEEWNNGTLYHEEDDTFKIVNIEEV